MRVIEKPKLGHYPIALIPGQFTDHYRSYSSNQLKYMPLNTAVKTAPKRPQAFHMATATYKINAAKRARMKARGKYFSFKFFIGYLWSSSVIKTQREFRVGNIWHIYFR